MNNRHQIKITNHTQGFVSIEDNAVVEIANQAATFLENIGSNVSMYIHGNHDVYIQGNVGANTEIHVLDHARVIFLQKQNQDVMDKIYDVDDKKRILTLINIFASSGHISQLNTPTGPLRDIEWRSNENGMIAISCKNNVGVQSGMFIKGSSFRIFEDQIFVDNRVIRGGDPRLTTFIKFYPDGIIAINNIDHGGVAGLLCRGKSFQITDNGRVLIDNVDVSLNDTHPCVLMKVRAQDGLVTVKQGNNNALFAGRGFFLDRNLDSVILQIDGEGIEKKIPISASNDTFYKIPPELREEPGASAPQLADVQRELFFQQRRDSNPGEKDDTKKPDGHRLK